MSDMPAGGSRAALFLSPLRARMAAPSARFWLIPAFLAFVLLVPLLRDGLPVTQAGLLPLNSEVAHYLYRTFGVDIGFFPQGVGWFKLTIAATTILSALAVGIYGWEKWKSQDWWVASLWLTLPFVISLVYQRGTPFLVVLPISWLVVGRFIMTQMGGRRSRETLNWAAWFVAVAIFTVLGRILWLAPIWTLEPPLYAHQLFSGAWSPSGNWREWVGEPSYLIGVVPFGLGVLTALVAWPHRADSIGRHVLILLGVATICLVLPLVLPTPVVVLLIAATVSLVLAIGALPVLDTRYASFPVQVAILAIALLSVYPYLRPAWFEVLPTATQAVIVGNNELWLANLHADRAEGNIVVEAWWQSTATMPKEYTAFVHFLDDQEQIVAQSDALLIDSDAVPTTGWSPGYVVTQTYTVPDSATITHIRYGVYDRETLERLSIRDRGDGQSVIIENAVIIPVSPAP